MNALVSTSTTTSVVSNSLETIKSQLLQAKAEGKDVWYDARKAISDAWWKEVSTDVEGESAEEHNARCDRAWALKDELNKIVDQILGF